MPGPKSLDNCSPSGTGNMLMSLVENSFRESSSGKVCKRNSVTPPYSVSVWSTSSMTSLHHGRDSITSFSFSTKSLSSSLDFPPFTLAFLLEAVVVELPLLARFPMETDTYFETWWSAASWKSGGVTLNQCQNPKIFRLIRFLMGHPPKSFRNQGVKSKHDFRWMSVPFLRNDSVGPKPSHQKNIVLTRVDLVHHS